MLGVTADSRTVISLAASLVAADLKFGDGAVSQRFDLP